MSSNRGWRTWAGCIALLASLEPAAMGGTFGRVVAIGGHASDLALDEARGVLYVANFTANRIEVLSLATHTIQTSINVAPQPGSLSLSPDGRYLVVVHFGNFAPPASPNNALTVIDLRNGNSRQTFALGNPPLGVAFGIDNRALIVTTSEFLLFEPLTGVLTTIDTVAGVTAKQLPVESGNFPANVVASSLAASGDGLTIYGITAAGTDNRTLQFSYDVTTRRLVAFGVISEPPLGPRAITVNRDGSRYAAGWALNDRRGHLLAQFPGPSGILNIGSLALDSTRSLLYAQVITGPAGGGGAAGGSAPAQPPRLQVVDSDNLAVYETLQLRENLAGKAVMNSDDSVMYAISESGVTILPVGSMDRERRVVASTEDLVFRGNFCDRRVASQQFTLTDPGGNATDFTLSSTLPGVSVSPVSGVTPATITVRVDPNAFQNQKGTVSGLIQIASVRGVNVPAPVRVLVNNQEPDQRGSFYNVPGKLVDILADPVRDRFYILRQDKNQVLVFDGTTFAQIATLKTTNTPTQLAITFDRRFLLVGSDNSQIIPVFDLDTLLALPPVIMPGGHYPRSIAASGKAILAANRVAGPVHMIDRVDLASRLATPLPSLGIHKNDIHISTMMVASANGTHILAASADGTLRLYNANVDNFTITRKEGTSQAGAYAASNFDQFVVGNLLLNASLVPERQFETGTGLSSGFAFVDQGGFRTTAPNSASPGVIQRVNLATGEGLRATRMVEAPILGETGFPFTRTVAPLYSRASLIVLSTSGFTALPWNYDASSVTPAIERVVNAADLTQAVAPGGLISIFGADLSPVNEATRQIPLPTALGSSCLTVNGVPVPVLFVSPSQINAQLPFAVDGNVTLILRTPAGVSDNYNLTILPTAPSVFRTGVAGPDTTVPLVVRHRNGEVVTPSNPLHRGDALTIYLTGMGRTLPAVQEGVPAPSEPLAATVVAPTVDIAGHELPVSFAGLVPGQVGVYQINATVPGAVPTGMSLRLTIRQGSFSTAVAVRVVN